MDSNGIRQDIAANFYAAAYQDAAGNLVISYRGTDDPVFGDVPAWTGGLGFQTTQAELAAKFYYQVKQAHPNATITQTGHSLGGGLAGLVSKVTGSTAYIYDNMLLEPAAENAYEIAMRSDGELNDLAMLGCNPTSALSRSNVNFA